MTAPRERAGKAKVNGCAGYSAIVAGVAVGEQPRVEFRIHTRGLPERFLEFTPNQTRLLIRSLEAALVAAEGLTRRDGDAETSGARAAPAEDIQDGYGTTN